MPRLMLPSPSNTCVDTRIPVMCCLEASTPKCLCSQYRPLDTAGSGRSERPHSAFLDPECAFSEVCKHHLQGNTGDLGSIPGSVRPPGAGNGTHSSTLAWRTPWVEEPGGLLSVGPQRVGLNDFHTHTLSVRNLCQTSHKDVC